MQYMLTRYSVKAGHEAEVEEFLKIVNERKSEVLEMLMDGEITLDCSFTEVIDAKLYLYIFLRLKDVEKTIELLERKSRPLYAYMESAVAQFTESKLTMQAKASFDIVEASLK